MKKINMVTTHNLDELTINVLQSFVVRFQRIYQLWAGIQDSLG